MRFITGAKTLSNGLILATRVLQNAGEVSSEFKVGKPSTLRSFSPTKRGPQDDSGLEVVKVARGRIEERIAKAQMRRRIGSMGWR